MRTVAAPFVLCSLLLCALVACSPDGPRAVLDVASMGARPAALTAVAPVGTAGSSVLWEDPTTNGAALWQLSYARLSRDVVAGYPGGGWRAMAGGDFDKDGHGDVAWYNPASRQIVIWKMWGTSIFSQAVAGTAPDANTFALKSGDFNGDGQSDLLALSSTQQPGAPIFARKLVTGANMALSSFGPLEQLPAPLAAIGDFNLDGRSDLAFMVNGQPTLWTTSNDGSHNQYTVGNIQTADWRIVGAADFNKDNVSDLVLWSQTTGGLSIWQLGTRPGDLILPVSTPWTIGLEWTPKLVGDVDGDRIGDIVWRHRDGMAAVWLMGSATVLNYGGAAIAAGKNWTLVDLTPLAVAPPPPPALPAALAPSPLPARAPRVLVVPCAFSDRANTATLPGINNYFNNTFSPDIKSMSYGAWNPVITIPQTWYVAGTYASVFRTMVQNGNAGRTATAHICTDLASAQYPPGSYDLLVAMWGFEGDGSDTNGDGAPDGVEFFGGTGLTQLIPRTLDWAGMQELLHGLGLFQHSYSESRVVYGDQWDVMSCYNCFSYNLNAFYRSLVFGLPSNRYPTVVRGVTRLALAATERPDALGALAASIDKSVTGLPYYLEFRTKTGLDQAIPTDTVLIHQSAANLSLLMGSDTNPQWVPGRMYTSADSSGLLKVAVKNTAPVSGYAIVDVALGGSTAQPVCAAPVSYGAGAPAEPALTVCSDTVWSKTFIPVCWESGGNDTEKAWVQDAVTRTWSMESNVVFSGWAQCDANFWSGIRIRVGDERSHTLGVGTQIDNVPNGVVLDFWFDGPDAISSCFNNREGCIRTLAVHEFGHALGFGHAGDRTDRFVACGAAQPWRSAMSLEAYCNPAGADSSLMSQNSVDGVQRYYGGPRSVLVSPRSADVPIGAPLLGTAAMARLSDQGAWARFPTGSNVWSAWTTVGGQLYGAPAPVSWRRSRVDVFARGTDDNLFQSWYDSGSALGTWFSFGVPIMGDPTAIPGAPGTQSLHIVVRDPNGRPLHFQWDAAVGWEAWNQAIPGGSPASGNIAAVADDVGSVHVFWTGTDQHLWHSHGTRSANVWSFSTADDLGGRLTSSPAAVLATDTWVIDIFGRATDGSVYTRRLSSDWQPLGGWISGNPSASGSDNGTDVVVRGSDGAVYHNHRSGSTWTGWIRRGGNVIGSPTAAQFGSTFQVLYRAAVGGGLEALTQGSADAWPVTALGGPIY
jgi:hypothetical protein